MYAVFPSSDTATSCGSLPAGTRATIFKLPGSTITKVFCSFSSTSNAPGGVFAALQAANTPPGALLVLEKEQNTLVIVDPGSLKIVARVPAGKDPHEVAVSDDGKTAYISNYGA